MYHDVAVIEQDPAAFDVSFDPQSMLAQAVLEAMIDLLAHGMQLAAARAGGQDEIVEFRSHLPHVEDHDVTSSIVSRSLGRCES